MSELTISVTELTPPNSPPNLEKEQPLEEDVEQSGDEEISANYLNDQERPENDDQTPSPSQPPQLPCDPPEISGRKRGPGSAINNDPLDLSLRQALPSFETVLSSSSATGSILDGEEMSEASFRSLNELANLQKRFMDTSEIQNYAEQLQKVANGPSVPLTTSGLESSQYSIVNGAAAALSAISANMPPPSFLPADPAFLSMYNSNHDLKALCQNLPLQPLQYHLAAYSLWSSNYAMAMSKAQMQTQFSMTQAQNTSALTNTLSPSHIPMLPTNSSALMNAARGYRKDYPSDSQQHMFKPVSGGHQNKNVNYPGNPLPMNAPPEAFGISMRGNQKYSAYYQKPFQMPLSSSIATTIPSKRDSTPHKKPSTSTVTSSGHGDNRVAPLINHESRSSVGSREDKDKSLSRSSETAFVCSCGEEFENLYIFTLHMKDSDHHPRSTQSYRNIPKLVRGQDMWINSETEQTREILRCMHCHQSFPTLPDLTMHMIKTNHYSEIVYSDSGRCVLVNSDDHKKSSEKASSSISTASSSNKESPNQSKSQLNGQRATPDKSISKIEEDDGTPPVKKLKLVEEEKEATHVTTTTSIYSPPAECSPNQINTSDCCKSNRNRYIKHNSTEITEADSATVDSVTDSDSVTSTSRLHSPNTTQSAFMADDSGTTQKHSSHASTDSVIRQIESFVEKNLPRVSVKVRSNHIKHSSNGKYFNSLSPCGKTSKSITESIFHDRKNSNSSNRSLSSVPYVAPPELESRPLENPLSSLQKLVDTTHKTSDLKTTSPLFSMQSNHSSEDLLKLSKHLSTIGSHGTTSTSIISSPSITLSNSNAERSLSSLMPSSPTVIMVNPTYIYQPTFPPSLANQMCPPHGYHWYPSSLPLFDPSMQTSKDDVNTDRSTPSKPSESGDNKPARPDTEDENDSIGDPVDLTKLKYACKQTGKEHTQLSNKEPKTKESQSNNEPMSTSSPITSTPPISSTNQQPPMSVSSRSPVVSLHQLSQAHGVPHPSHHQTGSATTGAIIKKAKCNYCGKPFANKGQVRLHVSKGKCPSLLQQQSCHQPSPLSLMSTACSSSDGSSSGIPGMSFANHLPGMPPTLPPGGFMASPFAYHHFPSIQDYMERMAVSLMGVTNDMQMGGLPPTLAATVSANEERLQLYNALAKQLSGN